MFSTAMMVKKSLISLASVQSMAFCPLGIVFENYSEDFRRQAFLKNMTV